MSLITFPRWQAFASLLRADCTIQWRHKRALVMTFIGPMILLFLFKGLIAKGTLDAWAVFSLSMVIFWPAIGILGYSVSLARDRDRGVFQRLCVAPVPGWAIMASRALVQIGIIFATTICALVFGMFVDQLVANWLIVLLVLLVSIVGGAGYVAMGQLLAGIMKSSESVSAVGRLVYLPPILAGLLSQYGVLGQTVQRIVTWSPYGTSGTLFQAATHPEAWGGRSWIALGVTLVYVAVGMSLGVKLFRWNAA